MGEEKRREISFRELRSGRFSCVYCGERGLTIDHVPPRSAFNSDRPRGLEFPSCHRCNDATRDLDLIVGWCAQAGSWTDPKRGDRIGNMLQRIKERFPEFSNSFRRAGPKIKVTPSGLILPAPIVELTVDEYFHAVVMQFGLKFALAMHWKSTNKIASDQHRIVVFSLPNQNSQPGSIPYEIYKYFSDTQHLVQGIKNSTGYFSYAIGCTDDQSISGQLATVGLMFSCVTFVVSPELTDRIDSRSDFPRARVFNRKQLLTQYPFGLKRLNNSQIRLRQAIMDVRIND